MELTPIAKQFVVHWGEMGSAWGVNRTVAQLHALLFFHGRPLNAEEIADTLGAILKYQDDIQKLQGLETTKILAEVKKALV